MDDKKSREQEQHELEQYEKVKEITTALNDMLKDTGLSITLSESNWNRNIYTQATEVAYQVADYVLVLKVPDIWLENRDGQLENYIGQTLATNLTILFDASFGSEFSEAKHERCECGCCHVPDHGACQSFEKGANGRCVYCDHGKDCHPGNPKRFNTPLGIG